MPRAFTGPEIRRLQFRRGRARHVQGPRHPALQPARPHRGHDHRGLRHRRDRRLQLHPRRDLGGVRALRARRWTRRARRATSARTSSAAASTSSCTPTTASAPTSAARRRRCSNPSRARRASRASSRRSPRATASTASPRRSTTPRPSPRCPRSSSNGADWFLELGRPNNGGTKIFSVSGHVNRPGNYEVRLGTPFAKLLEMAGGMRGGKKLKARDPGRLLDAGAAGRRDDVARHGLRLDREGGVVPGLGRGHRHGRGHLHGEGGRAPRLLLLRGIVRAVHAVPRGHRLALADHPPHRERRRAAARTSTCSSISPTTSRAAPSARWATPPRCRCAPS